MDHPKINIGDWVTVGNSDCVVWAVSKEGTSDTICVVVCNKNKPTTLPVGWDGEKWFLVPIPDYGGYARDTDRLVQQLKRGRPREPF
jgi:hypothetical protein